MELLPCCAMTLLLAKAAIATSAVKNSLLPFMVSPPLGVIVVENPGILSMCVYAQKAPL